MWLYVLGVVVFAVGLLASIALHELGHMSFAKLFNVKVTQYMVGFGPTAWSRKKGDTEYGVKWIPLGGYIRMIGMIPPRADGASLPLAATDGPGRRGLPGHEPVRGDRRPRTSPAVLPADAGQEDGGDARRAGHELLIFVVLTTVLLLAIGMQKQSDADHDGREGLPDAVGGRRRAHRREPVPHRAPSRRRPRAGCATATS